MIGSMVSTILSRIRSESTSTEQEHEREQMKDIPTEGREKGEKQGS